jgi:hypothetical protein
MSGRRYYFTTLGAWQRHAGRCAETHFVAVSMAEEEDRNGVCGEQTQAEARLGEQACATGDATEILALVDADEGAHLAMEKDAEFEPLPHPLARVPVSQRVSAALAQFGVAPGDDTFTVADKLSRVNPLLRHRVF